MFAGKIIKSVSIKNHINNKGSSVDICTVNGMGTIYYTIHEKIQVQGYLPGIDIVLKAEALPQTDVYNASDYKTTVYTNDFDMSSINDRLTPLFHELWGQAQSSSAYSKKQWLEFGDILGKMGLL